MKENFHEETYYEELIARRLFIFYLITATIFSIYRIITSISNDNISVIAPVIAILYLSLLICTLKIKRSYKICAIIMFILSYIGATISFLTRGGAEGPAPYLFFIGIMVVLTVFAGRLRIITGISMILGVIVLLYFQDVFSIPSILPEKKVNIELFFLGTVVLMMVLAIYLKQNLILYNQKIEQKRTQLELASEALKQQSEVLESMHLETLNLNQNLEKMVNSRTEEVVNKNQELQEYAFVNAHLLRAPLTRVMGLISLMEIKGQVSPEETKDLNETSHETDRVIRKISEILS